MSSILHDPHGYLERMAKPLQEKLKIVQFIPESAHDILDVGVADGTVTMAMANLFPDREFKGIDLNDAFIQQAKKKSEGIQNVEFETIYLREMLPRKKRYDAVTFCSVLHEFFTYGEGISSVLKALADAHELLNTGGRIIIRDMILHGYTKDSDLLVDRIVKKILATSHRSTLEEFENQFEKITSIYQLNHYLLKYMYTDNWSHELPEFYVPVTFEQYERIFELLGMRVLFKRSYLIGFLRTRWREDFGLTEEEINPFRSTGFLIAEKV